MFSDEDLIRMALEEEAENWDSLRKDNEEEIIDVEIIYSEEEENES